MTEARTAVLRDAASGGTIAERVVLGMGFWSRFRGLMGRADLPAGEGLYLPDTGIHMLFMRFPIDALFVGPADPAGERPVLAVRHALPPWRGLVLLVRGAQGVVELPAGTIAAAGLAVGSRVRLDP